MSVASKDSCYFRHIVALAILQRFHIPHILHTTYMLHPERSDASNFCMNFDKKNVLAEINWWNVKYWLKLFHYFNIYLFFYSDLFQFTICCRYSKSQVIFTYVIESLLKFSWNTNVKEKFHFKFQPTFLSAYFLLWYLTIDLLLSCTTVSLFSKKTLFENFLCIEFRKITAIRKLLEPKPVASFRQQLFTSLFFFFVLMSHPVVQNLLRQIYLNISMPV